jgi:thymidylate kinase
VLNEMLRTQGLTLEPARSPDDHGATVPPAQRHVSQKDLLVALFRALEENGVCYCVLHSWESLPDELPSDLDLAIHPRDREKLTLVWRALHDTGYRVVQCLNYAVGGYYFVLFWFEALTPKIVAIDIIFEHRRNGLILASGEDLVAERRRERMFWIPDPVIEFQYLLTKKILKNSLPSKQEKRLRLLVQKVGRVRAEAISVRLFGQSWKSTAVDACLQGGLSSLLRQLRKALWRAAVRQNPLSPIRNLFTDFLRRKRRWFQYTGVFVAILGPDGVGKSTLAAHLIQALGPAFRRHDLFHWRPEFVLRRDRSSVSLPHQQRQRSSALSAAHLFAHLLDYMLGYYFVIRPALARSGLVVFDRYYHDLAVDPKRYRYGGPKWLARALRWLVPQPDLILILDAPEEVTLSRKQEVPRDELQRQRRSYLEWLGRFSSSHVIDANHLQSQVTAEAAQVVTGYMEQRLERRGAFWYPDNRNPARRMVLSSRGRSSAKTGVLGKALDQLSGTPPTQFSRTKQEDPSRGNGAKAISDEHSRCHRFVVLPSEKTPRWLLPLGDSRKTRRGLQIYCPYAPKARLLKVLLTGAIDLGWQGWACPKVFLASEDILALETLVRENTGENRPVFALSLGTPGRYRKLTIQVMGADARILGYIKLPLTDAATERVRSESEVLQRLWSFETLRPYIPRVLYAGAWSDGYVLFLSSGPSLWGPVEFGVEHDTFLRLLWDVHRSARMGQELVDEVALRWRKAELHLSTEWGELGEKALERATRDLGGQTISCGLSHGDFAPWNTRKDNDRIFVLDWESATTAPNLWDIFHFHMQVRSLLHRGNRLDLPFNLSSVEKASLLLFVLDSISHLLDEQGEVRTPQIAYRRGLLIKALCRA